jgi:hypothetical protein
MIGDDTAYSSQDGNIDDETDPGNITLVRVGDRYITSGQLTSSIFDMGITPNYVNILWEPSAQPVATGATPVTFQIATSAASSTNSWNFLGPDGTSGSVYDPTTPVVASIHNGQRYLRYRAFLSTASSTVTPTLSDITVSYTNDCTPPGQAYFGSLSDDEYTVQISRSGYQTVTESLTVNGDIHYGVDMVSN